MGNRPSFMLQDEEITAISEETGFTQAQVERLYSRFTALDKSGNGSLSRQDLMAIPELAINPLCERIVYMFFIDCDDDHDRINFRQFMNVLATFRSSSKGSPPSRSRNLSRQESIGQQLQQTITKQAPLLFDSIDPSPLSALSRHHSRHSSFHDGLHDYHNHGHHHHHHHHHNHHTTNQHSIHYAASSATLSSLANDDEPLNSGKHKLMFMFKIYDVNKDQLVDIEDLIAILKLMVGNYVDEPNVRRIAERTLREADKNCDGVIDYDEFCAAFSDKDIEESLRVNYQSFLL